MNKKNRLETPEVIKPIPGFKVMEWLRRVRDEHYRLSVEDPEAYKKMRERGRRKLREMARKEGKEVIGSSELY